MADRINTTSGTSRLGYRINAVGVFGFLVIFLWAMVAIFAPYLIPIRLVKSSISIISAP